MEEIYVNIDDLKPIDPSPSVNQTGPRKSEWRYHGCLVLCLGLLSVSLLAGLIGLCVICCPPIFRSPKNENSVTAVGKTTEKKLLHKADMDSVRNSSEELSAIKANLTGRLQASIGELSSMSAERDQLNASLSEMTKKLDRLLTSKWKKTCAAGWRMFNCNCYLFSDRSDSWEKGRQDCRQREADLVIIDSLEEQKFLHQSIKKSSWIGLNDSETEGTWKWIDGTPVTLAYWSHGQPDNGNGDPKYGEEDCAQIVPLVKTTESWNDLKCYGSLQWICEKGTDFNKF